MFVSKFGHQIVMGMIVIVCKLCYVCNFVQIVKLGFSVFFLARFSKSGLLS